MSPHRVVSVVHHLILAHIIVMVAIRPLIVGPVVDITLPILMLMLIVVHLVWHALTTVHLVPSSLVASELVAAHG